MDVDTALSEVPINLMPLIDSGDFVTREESVVYNQAGLDLVWNFVTTGGAFTQTAVTPTDTAGNYDWVNQGNGMYTIEIPASGGASINNDTEGFGWFTGFATGILPWRGPVIGFRAAGINNKLIDDAYSTERGLSGTALPAAAADAAGGLPISDAGGLDLDARLDAAVSSRLAPTTAGRTLDVSTGGAAGVDWANVESQGTTVNLLATSVAAAASVTGNVGGNVIGQVNGNVAGNVVGSVGSVAANGITAATFAADVDAEILSYLVDDATRIDASALNTASAAVGPDGSGLTEAGGTGDHLTALATAASVAALNDLSTSDIDARLAAIRLDELLAADSDIDGAAPPTVGSVFHELMSKTAGSFTFDQTADSLEAIRDRGDAAWITATSVTVSDKTGFSLAAGGLDAVTLPANLITATSIAADAITSDKVAASVHQELIELAFTYDATATYASADAGSLVKQIADNAGGSALTAADIADAVWEEAIADHSGTAGSTAEALNAAGSAGDPWTTQLPGAYGAGSAGKIIGDNVNATISSRASQTSVDDVPTVAEFEARTLVAASYATASALDAVDNFIDTEIGTIITHLTDIKGATFSGATDSLEAIRNQGDAAWLTATGFSTHSATDVWAAAERTLTAGTNIVLAKGTGVTGFNDLSAAQVNAEVDQALADVGVTTTVTGRIDAAISTRASQTSVDDVPTNAELATAITTGLTTVLTEGYRGTGATGSVRDLLYEVIAHLGEFANAGTTKTLKKIDGSTTAKTFTYDDADSPTSITETT